MPSRTAYCLQVQLCAASKVGIWTERRDYATSQLCNVHFKDRNAPHDLSRLRSVTAKAGESVVVFRVLAAGQGSEILLAKGGVVETTSGLRGTRKLAGPTNETQDAAREDQQSKGFDRLMQIILALLNYSGVQLGQTTSSLACGKIEPVMSNYGRLGVDASCHCMSLKLPLQAFSTRHLLYC